MNLKKITSKQDVVDIMKSMKPYSANYNPVAGEDDVIVIDGNFHKAEIFKVKDISFCFISADNRRAIYDFGKTASWIFSSRRTVNDKYNLV